MREAMMGWGMVVGVEGDRCCTHTFTHTHTHTHTNTMILTTNTSASTASLRDVLQSLFFCGSSSSPKCSSSKEMKSLDYSRGTSRGVAIFYMSLGMALYYLLEEGLSRTRLVERLRLEVLRLWSILLLGQKDDSPPVANDNNNNNDNNHDNDGSDERPEMPPKKYSRETGIPFSLQDLLKEVNNSEEETSQIVELVTKWNSLTSHLGVSMIRLAPQRALDLQESKGLEFYYVIKGTGEFAQFFAEDEGRRKCTTPISVGDAWTMEPNRPRWISNSGKGDLILLRSSDNAEGGYDKVYAKELFSWRWNN